jgi:hypothetical protein
MLATGCAGTAGSVAAPAAALVRSSCGVHSTAGAAVSYSLCTAGYVPLVALLGPAVVCTEVHTFIRMKGKAMATADR